MPRRVAVTGGSGTIGAHVVREFLDQGCEVWNFDQIKPAVALTRTVLVDTTNFGDLVSCLAGFDAVVHLAAIASPRKVSNNQTFRTNAVSDFNVLEAASVLRINHVVLASSLNAVGMTYNLRPCVEYLPLDEEHPCRPDEAYGLSKLVAETLGHGFARRYPEMTICSLRFPMVLLPDGYRRLAMSDEYMSKILWAYTDVREAARAVRLASEATWQGHEVFLIAADHTPSKLPSSELVARWYPQVPLRAELVGQMALVSARKAERLLGWRHGRTFAASFAESPA